MNKTKINTEYDDIYWGEKRRRKESTDSWNEPFDIVVTEVCQDESLNNFCDEHHRRP